MSHPTTGRFDDGTWCVIWNIYMAEPEQVMLSFEDPDGPDDWFAITVSLTLERAMLLRLAIDRALEAMVPPPAPVA